MAVARLVQDQLGRLGLVLEGPRVDSRLPHSQAMEGRVGSTLMEGWPNTAAVAVVGRATRSGSTIHPWVEAHFMVVVGVVAGAAWLPVEPSRVERQEELASVTRLAAEEPELQPRVPLEAMALMEEPRLPAVREAEAVPPIPVQALEAKVATEDFLQVAGAAEVRQLLGLVDWAGLAGPDELQ